MNNVMVDLETLGTEPGSVILSVSAVQFDIETGKTGKEFHSGISLKDSLKRGFKFDASTFYWWLKQGEDERMRLLENEHVTATLDVVLGDFAKWLTQLPHKEYRLLYPRHEIIVWGRGPRFDQGLLSFAYKHLGYDETPWYFRNERCVRTYESLSRRTAHSVTFEGTKHYGIDDAKHQIKQVSKIHNKIKTALNGTNESPADTGHTAVN